MPSITTTDPTTNSSLLCGPNHQLEMGWNGTPNKWPKISGIQNAKTFWSTLKLRKPTWFVTWGYQTTGLQTTNLPFIDSNHKDPYSGLLESPQNLVVYSTLYKKNKIKFYGFWFLYCGNHCGKTLPQLSNQPINQGFECQIHLPPQSLPNLHLNSSMISDELAVLLQAWRCAQPQRRHVFFL